MKFEQEKAAHEAFKQQKTFDRSLDSHRPVEAKKDLVNVYWQGMKTKL